MGWNINQRSNFGSKREIPSIIFEEINRQNADVIVLTEFVKVEKYRSFFQDLEMNDYKVINDPRDLLNMNQVLIAVKNNLLANNSFVVSTMPHNDSVNKLFPNFLHLSLTTQEKEIHIVGTRIRIENSTAEDFQERKLQLDTLTEYLQQLKGTVIVVGDFNNGWYQEGEKANSYEGRSREFYSYPLMKQIVNAIGFEVHTPKNSYSWNNGFKLDHILTKGAKLFNPLYDWEFTESKDYIQNAIGMPDHAVLTAQVAI